MTSTLVSPYDQLDCFCVYYDPRDYPGKYVVRRWIGLHPEAEPRCVVKSLDDARKSVPPGYIRIERWRDDDPKIFEVWL